MCLRAGFREPSLGRNVYGQFERNKRGGDRKRKGLR